MTLVGANDGYDGSYIDIAEGIAELCQNADQNLKELYRRMLFNVLVSSTDDHYRNHGFLYSESSGWNLSPAYDINPTKFEHSHRVHAIALDEYDDKEGSLQTVLASANYFGLSSREARGVMNEVGEAIVGWHKKALHFGLRPQDIKFMCSAFEHDDLEFALSPVDSGLNLKPIKTK